MRTTLLTLSLLAGGLGASAATPLQRVGVNGMTTPVSLVEQSPCAENSPLALRVAGLPQRVDSPTKDPNNLVMDSKTLSYLSPDPFYPLGLWQVRAMVDNKLDILTGFDNDLLSRFKGNRIKNINVVVDHELVGVTVFIKNADLETVFEQELDLDSLEPYFWEIPGYGEVSWGKTAEVPVDYEIGDEVFYVGYTVEVSEDSAYGYFNLFAQNDLTHNLGCLVDRYDGNGPLALTACIPVIWCETEGEGGLAAYDVTMNGITDVRSKCGEEYMVSGTLTNFGTEPIMDMTFNYTDGDGVQKEQVLSSAEPLPYMTTISFNLPLKADEEAGVYNKTVGVSDINGVSCDLGQNGNCGYSLMAVEDSGSRVILVEDYTGEWCGYCTRGMAGLDLLNEKYPDNVITLEYHVYDSLWIEEGVPGYPEMEKWIPGYPNSIVNHCLVADPWNGLDPEAEFGMGDLVKMLIDRPVEVSIDADAVYDAGSGEVIVSTELLTTLDIPDGSIYEIGFTVAEDGYTGVQSNNYSSEYGYFNKEDLNEALWTYYDLPKAFLCNYDDVVRDGYGVIGNPGSVPAAPIESGVPVSYSVSFPLNNVADVEKVNVVAYVMAANTKEVLNAVKTPLQISNGVESVALRSSVNRTADGIEVVSDGFMTVNVYSADGRLVASGSGRDAVSMSLPVAKGVYVVNVESGAGRSAVKVAF